MNKWGVWKGWHLMKTTFQVKIHLGTIRGYTDRNRSPCRHHSNRLQELFYNRRSGPPYTELTSHHQPEEFRKVKGDAIRPTTSQFFLAGIHLGWAMREPQGSTLSQNDCVGASVRKAGETPSWSLSSILKTGCEWGLNPAQEWGNHC